MARDNDPGVDLLRDVISQRRAAMEPRSPAAFPILHAQFFAALTPARLTYILFSLNLRPADLQAM